MNISAVVLATDSSGSLPLFGIPAFLRLIKLLTQAGIEDIHVIGGKIAVDELILKELSKTVHFHETGDISKIEEILRRLSSSRERFLVMKANHVIDRGTLTYFLREATNKDISLCLRGRGKSEAEGIFLVSSRSLIKVVTFLWPSEVDPRALPEEMRIIQARTSFPCLLRNVSSAEEKLVEALKLQTEDSDGFLARHFDRPVSRFISKRLARTRISPNQVTLIGVTIGLTGAWLFSFPYYLAQMLGAALFLFCVIIDGVDGELARLTLRESTFGHYLDVITDNLVHVAIFIGIAYGLYNETENPFYLWALWIMLIGFGLCGISVYQCILRKSPQHIQQSPKLTRFMAALTNRDFAYLLFFLAAIHRLNWFFVGSVFGTYLFATVLWAVHWYDKVKVFSRVKTR